MKHKTFDLVETKTDGDAGTFTALASVFNNVDLVGDRILPGAFAKTLGQWRADGHPIPVILSHSWDDPFASIGVADPGDVKETPDGLLVKGALDIEDNDVAKQVYKLMKRGTLRGWSFGYTVPKGGEQIDSKGVNNISQVDLVEVGPTLKGANPEAQLQAVKSAGSVPGMVFMPTKAVWSTAYINDLPDSAFLYIEDGGEKDEDGKTTPRSLRHFPFKDADGNVDSPHLRNALSRIPQSSLPESVKDRLAEKARRMLNGMQSAALSVVEDEQNEEPLAAKSRSQDPLRAQLDRLRLEVARGH